MANNDPLNYESQDQPTSTITKNGAQEEDVALQPLSDGSPYRLPLQRIIDSAHVPAVSYACVLPNEDKTEFTPVSTAVGKKDAQSAESKTSAVDKKEPMGSESNGTKLRN